MPTPTEQKQALRRLIAATQLDGTRLLEAFQDPHPGPADAAWAARKVYRTRDEAKADVFDYIERFYNPKRRHSTIGYMSPMEFEMKMGLA